MKNNMEKNWIFEYADMDSNVYYDNDIFIGDCRSATKEVGRRTIKLEQEKKIEIKKIELLNLG